MKGHYEAWLLFFIEGIIESTQHALDCIDALLALRDKNSALLSNIKGKQKTTVCLLFAYLESHPIIDIKQASAAIKKTFNAVANAVDALVDLGILKQISGQKRYRTFAYEDYLTILRDGSE